MPTEVRIMAVRIYRVREHFALEHPLVMKRADAYALERPTDCRWVFEHAIYDNKRRNYVVAYTTDRRTNPDPCILTIEIQSAGGRLDVSEYQRFE